MSDQTARSSRFRNIVQRSTSLTARLSRCSTKRAGHSLVIRGLKPGAHLGLYDPKREEEIFEKVDSYN